VRVRKFETIAANNKTRTALAVAPTIQTRGAKKKDGAGAKYSECKPQDQNGVGAGAKDSN